MYLTYLGHSCFLLENSLGKKLIIDTFKNIGYDMPKVEADIVCYSHTHYDHYNLEGVLGYSEIVNKNYEGNGYKIEVQKSYHDAKKGELRGENNITKIEFDGISILHLGDYGDSDFSIFDGYKNIDYLLIPIGGTYTIDYLDAKKISDKIKAKHVIPMHFKTSDCAIDISPPTNFLKEYSESEVLKIKKRFSLKDNDISEKIIYIEK